MWKMKDHLYDPPPRYRAIEAIHDALVKAGKAHPSNKRRFLTQKEADKLMGKWRDCKNANKFIALAKIRRCNACHFHEFERVRDNDPNCNLTLSEFIIDEALLFISMIRSELRKQDLLFGIDWPQDAYGCPDVDRLVFAYVELSKVTDRKGGYFDENQCDMYWLLMRRFYPKSK